MIGPNTKGKDYNFFDRVTISNTAFPTNSDVTFAFSGNPSFSLINEGTDTVEYSFNGLTKHGDLVPNTPSAALFFNNRGINSVWFRVLSGAPTDVRIEAAATGTFSACGVGGTSGGGGGATTISGPLGSKMKAQSVAVTLSTDEPALPVSGTITANIGTTNGLALDASLTSLSAKLGTLGQKAMAGSAPVVIASDQTTFPITNTGGAKGATVAATVTSTANGVDHQGLDSVEQFAPVYEDNTAGRALVEQRNTHLNITTATTTVVKSGSGFLHLIMVNAAAASATITIYDNTSAAGTKIGTVTMPATLLASQATLRFDVTFSTGLTIVTTGTEDLTISYR